MKTPSKTLTATGLLSLIAIFASVNASAQEVVTRARTGGYAEDVTYVTSGPLKHHAVMINGYDLYSVELAKKSALTRVCRLDTPEFDQFPNGLTFVASEGLFVVNNAPHPNKLFFFDQSCVFKGTRTIQYLDSNYRPAHIEGLAYIPESSAVFPDHLLMVVWDVPGAAIARIEVIRRDGVVVKEIHRPDWPAQLFSDGGLGDVTFLPPNRLLVSAFNPDSLWIMDFDGNIASGPLPTDGNGMGEGVVRLADGRVIATNYPQSLLLFDTELNRQPADDRHDVIGVNANVPNGIAWDSEASRFLITHDTPLSTGVARVSGLPTSLAAATPVVDLTTFGSLRQTVYLPQENLIAVLRFGPANNRSILTFNTDGTLNGQISLSPAALGQDLGQPLALAYLPDSDEFVVAFNGVSGPDLFLERTRLRVISRAGTLVRTIDLAATGSAGVAGVEYFEDPDEAAGRLLILSAGGRVFVTDLNGNSRRPNGARMREFNSRVKLGLITRSDVAAITSGPLAGAFAIVDSSGGEVVIFRLD